MRPRVNLNKRQCDVLRKWHATYPNLGSLELRQVQLQPPTPPGGQLLQRFASSSGFATAPAHSSYTHVNGGSGQSLTEKYASVFETRQSPSDSLVDVGLSGQGLFRMSAAENAVVVDCGGGVGVVSLEAVAGGLSQLVLQPGVLQKKKSR